MVGGRPVARLRGGIDATIYAAINARDLTPFSRMLNARSWVRGSSSSA